MNRFETIRDLIATTLGIPVGQITLETKQNDLSAWDSVTHLNLMLALEEAFSITLGIDEFPLLTSVSAILEHLESTCHSR